MSEDVVLRIGLQPPPLPEQSSDVDARCFQTFRDGHVHRRHVWWQVPERFQERITLAQLDHLQLKCSAYLAADRRARAPERRDASECGAGSLAPRQGDALERHHGRHLSHAQAADDGVLVAKLLRQR
eukprot:6610166-Prymnesium_polylepis.1